jgi:hypothetical protein
MVKEVFPIQFLKLYYLNLGSIIYKIILPPLGLLYLILLINKFVTLHK